MSLDFMLFVASVDFQTGRFFALVLVPFGTAETMTNFGSFMMGFSSITIVDLTLQ